jgi:hypothetical protein
MQSKIHNKYLIICLGMLSTLASFSQVKRDAYTRVGIAPVIGFYKLKSYHAVNPKAGMSFSAFIKREQSFDKSNRAFLSIGLEYLFHTVSYRSYYFNQDTLQLYDGGLNYHYRLNISEFNLPIQAKLTFKSTTNSLYTPYVSAGYNLRYIVDAQARIDQDGAKVKDEYVNLKFQTPFLYEKLNSSLCASFGVQNHRTRSNSTTVFLEICYRYGFSAYYFQTRYSASSVFISSQHLSLNIGLGF